MLQGPLQRGGQGNGEQDAQRADDSRAGDQDPGAQLREAPTGQLPVGQQAGAAGTAGYCRAAVQISATASRQRLPRRAAIPPALDDLGPTCGNGTAAAPAAGQARLPGRLWRAAISRLPGGLLVPMMGRWETAQDS